MAAGRTVLLLSALLLLAHGCGAHPAPLRRPSARRAAEQQAPVRCATLNSDIAKVTAGGARVETAVYGYPLSRLSAGMVKNALSNSSFPHWGITIPVHFHVMSYRGNPSVYESDGYNVTAKGLALQLEVASADYAPAGVSFRRASVTWWDNFDWTKDCEAERYNIANAVVRDPGRALNIILCEPPTSLGFALNLPNPFGFDQNMGGQGVFIHYKSLPDGPLGPYSGGRTFTHEVGHWAGLGHVFSYSCEGEGDGIGDTPMQKEPSGGCPVGKDSCPDRPGVDSINNFMDYSDDFCMRSFTTGQVARIQAVLLELRPDLVERSANPPPEEPPPDPDYRLQTVPRHRIRRPRRSGALRRRAGLQRPPPQR